MGRNKGIVLLKFFATFLITYSHLVTMFPDNMKGLVTGGAIGDGLFFFCSGFTLLIGRDDGPINWYKRRINRIYPTVIMWALLSSFLFGWDWNVLDLLFVPKYWFISCIMIYYILFYIIKHYLIEKLSVVICVTALMIFVSNFIVLDRTRSIMYAQLSFMRIYYFSFILLGALTAIKDRQNVERHSSLFYAIGAGCCLLLYYLCMAVYKIDAWWCQFQIISLLPLLGAIYFTFQWCNSVEISKIVEKKYIGKVIYFISGITLEVYMVQYALFTDKYNSFWPLNIVCVFFFIFIMAYLLKCSSRVFSLVFSDTPWKWKEIFKIV